MFSAHARKGTSSYMYPVCFFFFAAAADEAQTHVYVVGIS